MRVYVDGCSYTAGHGLESKYSLANLIALSGHEVVDRSREGKSNYAMALDLYSQPAFDFYVVGWTFSHRIEYQLDDQTIDGAIARPEIGLGNHPSGDILESEYRELNKRFFRYASRFELFSDFLIDSSAALIGHDRFVFFSWEKRNCKTDLLYFDFDESYRQSDMPNWRQHGHLTQQGMIKMSEIITPKIK